MTRNLLVTGSTVAAVGIVVGGAILALSVKLARVVVMPKPFRNVRVYDASNDRITLEANSRTTHSGTFGLAYDGGAGHAIIGPVVSQTRRRVERELLSVSGKPPSATRRSHWEGNVFAGPQHIDPAYQNVTVRTPGGDAPAWYIPPAAGSYDNNVWAIHVHGIRTTRINALRTVPVARSLGYTSLVVSYRGDGEGPDVPRGASMLGLHEWNDIDAAIKYALANGARSVVLFGWSMGASAVLLTTERSRHADIIAGTVLISPAVGWRQTIRHGAHIVGLPRFFGDLAVLALTNRWMSKVVGIPEPIDFDALDWTSAARIRTRCLIVHSKGDEKIPIELSRRTAAMNHGVADVFQSSNAMHAWEYNVGPEEFDGAIRTWLSSPPEIT